MPPRRQRYTLVGFSDAVDWKPLDFVKPLPRYMLCAACGLVRVMTALLPCGHSVCDCCRRECATDCGRQCPLDDNLYTDADVQWKYFNADNLKREVYCWNTQYGCEAVLAVSEVWKHFRSECVHHSTFCPRCSEAILCKSLCAHIRSHCSTLVVTSTSVTPRDLGERDEMITTRATKELLEKPVVEIKAALHSILSENNAQSNALNDLSQKMNIVIEAITQDPQVSARQTSQCFTRSAAQCSGTDDSVERRFRTSNSSLSEICDNLSGLREAITKVELATNRQRDTVAEAAADVGAIKLEVTESSRKLLHGTEKMLAQHSLLIGFCYFLVQGIKSLKRAATFEGKAQFYCGKIYLRGYCMSPGVCLQKQEQSVSLHILLFLHKGAIDDFIEWPFQKAIKLSVIHPISSLQRDIRCEFPKNSSIFRQKPVESSNEEGFFQRPSLCLNDLEREGYMLNNQLQCRWELL